MDYLCSNPYLRDVCLITERLGLQNRAISVPSFLQFKEIHGRNYKQLTNKEDDCSIPSLYVQGWSRRVGSATTGATRGEASASGQTSGVSTGECMRRQELRTRDWERSNARSRVGSSTWS